MSLLAFPAILSASLLYVPTLAFAVRYNSDPKTMQPGGMSSFANPTAEETDMAKQALSQVSPDLMFIKCVRVAHQVVAGLQYEFEIIGENRETSVESTYQVIYWIPPGTNAGVGTSFKIIKFDFAPILGGISPALKP